MLSYNSYKVSDIKEIYDDVTWVYLSNSEEKNILAINYNDITGPISKDDIVIANTTAVELNLGTGGQHFIIHNFRNKNKKFTSGGHIMKLRYTPLQIKCNLVEEEKSPYHNNIKEFTTLNGHIVILATLHSMLAPIAATIKYENPDININYIMSDDGALPIGFSNSVRELKEKDIINKTITIGHAFGGDYESLNLYNGIIASKEILDGDITIVAMGPGIVGTGTKYGFSGISQGENINIVNILGGKPLVVPRISFADKRERHKGISHHTLTILSEIALTSGVVIFPKLIEEKKELIDKQIKRFQLEDKHKIIFDKNPSNMKSVMDEYGLNTKTMGRGYTEDKEFFDTLNSIGKYAVKEWNGK